MSKAQRETVFEILFHVSRPGLNDQKHQVDRIAGTVFPDGSCSGL